MVRQHVASIVWAPLAGLAIGAAEWRLGDTTGGVRSLVWNSCVFALLSTAVALAASCLRRLGKFDPLWMWAWFWFGCYGVIYANILILPRQSFLTVPSLAMTVGVGAIAGGVSWVAARALRKIAPRVDWPFVMPAGAATVAVAVVLAVAIPLALPHPDLTTHHRPRKPGQKSAVLILVDTMRPDHLSCYGYRHPTSPSIDSLAARGTRFDEAWSSSSWTVPAVASLFSGLPLSTHHAGAIDTPFDTDPTLAGRLSSAGVLTAGFSSNHLVSPLYGFDRGFELFVSYRTGLVNPVLDLSEGTIISLVLRRGLDGDRMVVDQAKTWIRAHRDDRFFLYLHLFAPHRPYAPPPAYRARFVDDGYDGIEYQGAANGEMLPPRAQDNVVQRYDAEIAYADALVGEIVEQIASLGLDESTAVVVTSDHGEAFGEHGYWEHGQGLSVEETRIPLIVRMPGGKPAQVIRGAVSLTDLHATLLELLDTGPAGPGGPSVSLAMSVKTGVEPPTHPVISEIFGRPGSVHPETLEAVILGDARLVRNITRRSAELYDRSKDPAGTRLVENTDLSSMLESYLAPRWWERHDAVAARKIQMDEEDLHRLRSLGYVR